VVLFAYSGVATVDFLTPRAISKNGRPRKKMNFKKSMLFINAIFFEPIKSIFIKNIYFAAY
jgi:hypothetical protein